MGVSVLSIVEFFYFCTLRLGCNLRRRRLLKKHREAQEKLLENVQPALIEPDVEKVHPEDKF